MTVTPPVRLTPEENAKLLAQAKARNVSVDELLHNAVLQMIAVPGEANGEPMSPALWEKEFEEWLDGLPDLPVLSDDDISRETIYTREDEWR